MAGSRELLGLVDPSGMSMGFLVPLFGDGVSNVPLVQRIGPDGTIERFELYEVPDAPMLKAPFNRVSIGDPALHAFAFGTGDVVISEGGRRSALLDRIDDPALQARPMLAMELAHFLGMQDLRRTLAARTHAQMAKVSWETADRWLDLSVLTPELRRSLAQSRGSTRKTLSTNVVARVRRGVVEINGAGADLADEDREALRIAALNAVGALSPPYSPPANGWLLEVRAPATPPPPPRSAAAVLLASSKLRRLGREVPWPSSPDIQIHSLEGDGFRRAADETDTPLFVVYDLDDPEVVGGSAAGRAARDVHGIAIDPARRRVGRVDRPVPWNTTHVSAAGFGAAGRGEATGVRLAVAVELDRRAEKMRLPASATSLLRARGVGPDADADAIAALYDRAWGMGLAPWNSILVPGARGRTKPGPVYSDGYSAAFAVDRAPGWAADAVFETTPLLAGPLIDQVMGGTRSAAALLVDTKLRTEADLVRHRSAITRLLARSRWNISDADFRRGDARLVARGRRAEFEIMTRPSGVPPSSPQREILLQTDLSKVHRLLVNGPAAPGSVLAGLGSGELVVGMRDLASLDATEATALSIVAAQLRRQVTGMPSRSRTQLVALIAMQAFRSSRVDDGGVGLIEIIEDGRLGQLVHLAVRSTRTVAQALVAEIQILQTDRGGKEAPGTAGGFQMTVSPDVVTIAPVRR